MAKRIERKASGTSERSDRRKNRAAKVSLKQPGKKLHAQRPFFIACIGASAGGINALTTLVSQLPADINAALFIVVHFSGNVHGTQLAERLNEHTGLYCSNAIDGELIEPGRIYIAPPNTHLLVKKDHIALGHGPTENRFRPSIDVLFRSAAASYASRTIGIILTGLLNDGTAGLLAIHECGGHCVVQDPRQAEYADMPQSAIENVPVDHIAGLNEIAVVMLQIIRKSILRPAMVPSAVAAESKLSERAATEVSGVSSLGESTALTCPDCGGNLTRIEKGKMTYYRCHIGHNYSEKDFLNKQGEAIEQTLWVAVRIMEERKFLLQKMTRENREKGFEKMANQNVERTDQLTVHIDRLKDLLFSV